MTGQTGDPGRSPPQGPNQEDEQRRFHRMAVRWEAALSAGTDADGGGCLVLDMSPGGAKVQTQNPLPAETPVSLMLDRGGRFSGRVAWQHGSYFGILFDRTHDDFLSA